MARNLFRHDPVIGYRFVAGLKGRVRHEGGGYLVRCNAQGFRSDHDFSKTSKSGTSRILVFGDSNTAGDGVSNGKRFSDVLEQQIDGVETLNFGLPSSGADQQYLAWQEVGQHIEHDLLMLCPMVDNIRRNLQDARVIHSSMSGDLALLPKPYYTLSDTALELHNTPVPKGHRTYEATFDEPEDDAAGLRAVARNAMEKADKQFPGLRNWSQRMRRLALPEAYNDADSEGWQLMAAILRQWVSEAKTPVILAPIPMFEHIFGNLQSKPYRTRFQELADETGAVFVDILPQLKDEALSVRQGYRFATDEHPTVAGHARIAELMRPAVEAAWSKAAAPNSVTSAQ